MPSTTADAFDMEPQNELAARLLAEQSVPELLYHYTTASGLVGILGTKALWATDIRFLNDATELAYTLDLVEKRLEVLRTRIDGDLLERWRRSLRAVHNLRWYVACFSEDGDSLSQWRGYGRAGYSIGFRANDLIQLAADYSEPAILLQCVYDIEEQNRRIDEMFAFLQQRLQSAITGERSRALLLDAFEVHLFAHTVLLAVSFKHSSFHDEREWRLAIRPRKPERGMAGRKVRDGGRWLVPYRELSLCQDGAMRIGRIMVGPTPHGTLAEESVGIALSEYGIECDAVSGSDIPFRDW